MKNILGVVAVLILGVMGWFGYQYYQNTYVGVDAYAKVPNQIPEKKETVDSKGQTVKDSNGATFYSYNYKDLSFVKKDGKIQKSDYELSATTPTPFAPGTYLYAKVSKNRIVEGPNVIKEDQVPSELKEKVDKGE